MYRTGGRAAIAACVALLSALVVLQAGPSDAAVVRRKPRRPAPTPSTTAPAPATTTTVPAPTFTPATVAAVRAEADWALQAQLPDGALGHYVDKVKVWPYLANFTALGLARASEVTNDARYAAAAWRWLAWYQAHQDASGFVTDYDVVNGVAVSTGDMDSTDAYAGTFLVAARRTWLATGDTATLRTLQAGITNAVRAIEATQDADGLTWAKPAWKVKYLMDQAETWAGLRAAAALATALGDTALAQRATSGAARMQAGVDALWNQTTGAYDWAVHENGVRIATRWNVLYSDALQQAWAVAFGLVPPARAAQVMTRFGIEQPTWDEPAAVATYTSGTHATEYWPIAGWAFRQVGDATRATTAAANIRSAATTASRAWPYTPANAGQLIALLSADPRLLA
jgi:hypothetical protein